MNVIIASTPSTPRTAPPPATSAIGSSKGIAPQVSLPSISASRLLRRRTPGAGGARFFRDRRGVLDDALEQRRIDGAIGLRRYGVARFRQRAVAGVVEWRALAAHFRDPAVEFACLHRFHLELHVGEPIAAEICG